MTFPCSSANIAPSAVPANMVMIERSIAEPHMRPYGNPAIWTSRIVPTARKASGLISPHHGHLLTWETTSCAMSTIHNREAHRRSYRWPNDRLATNLSSLCGISPQKHVRWCAHSPQIGAMGNDTLRAILMCTEDHSLYKPMRRRRKHLSLGGIQTAYVRDTHSHSEAVQGVRPRHGVPRQPTGFRKPSRTTQVAVWTMRREFAPS